MTFLLAGFSRWRAIRVSGVRCQLSGVRCQVSVVRCKKEIYIYIYILFSFFEQRFLACRWRVCYQRGLPRLVSNLTRKMIKLIFAKSKIFCSKFFNKIHGYKGPTMYCFLSDKKFFWTNILSTHWLSVLGTAF